MKLNSNGSYLKKFDNIDSLFEMMDQLMYDKLKLNNRRVRIDNIPESLSTQLMSACTAFNGAAEIIINTIAQLTELSPIAEAFLAENELENRILYIIYPKTVINRDSLMTTGLKFGLKTIKLVRVNDNFSCMGFKLFSVVDASKMNRPSQCVNDYQEKIKPLKERLSLYQSVFEFYNRLTPGYQKDWARFVYSAIKSETQRKRFEQMCKALELGYKSIDQYKASLKKR